MIDNQFGNTCFWVTNEGTTFQISVTPGNYFPSEFVVELNAAFATAGFADFPLDPVTSIPIGPATYTKANAKLTISLDGGIDPDGHDINTLEEDTAFDAATDAYFTFFDFSGARNCFDGPACTKNKDMTFNHTLGWLMGFRLPIVPALTAGNTGGAVLDLQGPKYFILVLDDYNQNHINNGVVTITELSTSLSVPSYYNPGMPHDCTATSATNTATVLSDPQQMGDFALTNNAAFPTAAAMGKTNVAYSKTATVLPTAPRTRTQAQLYTINEITKNREKNTSYRGKAPNNSDTFAIIPIKMSGSIVTGQMYTDFSGSLQDNKRVYFGPVDIDRMRLKLVDDRGYTVDLHGADWCVTIIADVLYQY